MATLAIKRKDHEKRRIRIKALSKNKDVMINFRISGATANACDQIAEDMTAKANRPVTRSEVIRCILEAALPVIEIE